MYCFSWKSPKIFPLWFYEDVCCMKRVKLLFDNFSQIIQICFFLSKIRSSCFWYDNNHYFIIIFQFIKPSDSNPFVSIIETSSWLNWSYRFGDSTWSTSFISSASSRMSLRASSTSFVRRRSGVCAISGGSNTQNMSNSGIYQQ